MNYEGYPVASSWGDKIEYTFTSEGPKGKIPIIVQFTKTDYQGIYNLTFGNRNTDGSINDQVVNDNKDRNKILVTVSKIIYDFTSLSPDALVFFCGATPDRTRLYRMALSINIIQLREDFTIYGVFISEEGLIRIPFQKGLDYSGFIVQRKKPKFKI